MAALTSGRNTPGLLGPMSYEREVASGATVYAGGIVAQNSDGKAVAASDAANIVVLGRAEHTASAGEKVKIGTGVYIYDNGASTEAFSVTDIGKTAYALDDHTVGLVGGTNAVAVGTVLDVNTEGVTVRVNPVCGWMTAQLAGKAAVNHTHS